MGCTTSKGGVIVVHDNDSDHGSMTKMHVSKSTVVHHHHHHHEEDDNNNKENAPTVIEFNINTNTGTMMLS